MRQESKKNLFGFECNFLYLTAVNAQPGSAWLIDTGQLQKQDGGKKWQEIGKLVHFTSWKVFIGIYDINLPSFNSPRNRPFLL